METESELIDRIVSGDLGEWQTEVLESEDPDEETVPTMLLRVAKEIPHEIALTATSPAKGQFVFSKEEMYAIRQNVANLPRLDEIPAIYCKNEPGNLTENKMDQDKFRGPKGSRGPIRERKLKDGPTWTTTKDAEGFTTRTKRFPKEEDTEKPDESIILSPPRKAFPSSQLSPVLTRKSESDNSTPAASSMRYGPHVERGDHKTRSFGDRERVYPKRGGFKDKEEEEIANGSSDFSFNSPQAAQFHADKLRYQQKMNELKKEKESTNSAKESTLPVIDVDSLFAPGTDPDQQPMQLKIQGFFDDFKTANPLPPKLFVNPIPPPAEEEEVDTLEEERIASKAFGRWFNINKDKMDKSPSVQQPQQNSLPPQQNQQNSSTIESPAPQKLTVEMLFQSVQASNAPLPALPSVPINHTPKPISAIPTQTNNQTRNTPPIPSPTTPTFSTANVANGQGLTKKADQNPNSNSPLSALIFQPYSQQQTAKEKAIELDSAESISFITSLLSKNQVNPPPMNPSQMNPSITQQSPYVNSPQTTKPKQMPIQGSVDNLFTHYQQHPMPYYQQQQPFVAPPQLYPGNYANVRQMASSNNMGPTAQQQGGGLEKWFGNYVTATAPLPPLPNNVKMVSLEEIEKSQLRK